MSVKQFYWFVIVIVGFVIAVSPMSVETKTVYFGIWFVTFLPSLFLLLPNPMKAQRLYDEQRLKTCKLKAKYCISKRCPYYESCKSPFRGK